MKCNILHESPNRLRVHLHCARMSLHEADLLEYYLRSVDGVTEVTVYDRTQDTVVRYTGQRSAVIGALASFSFAKAEVMGLVPEHTSRALNREFEDKLAMTVMRRIFSKLFLPAPITTAMALYRSVKYIREGLTALWHGKLSVAVHVEVYYGYVLPELAAQLRTAIAEALATQAGVEVSSVDVYIDGLQFKA